MEYPGTKFTRPIRLSLLLFFIAAFFIIAPLLILYTAGYRYDWYNGLFNETGAISIDILPKNATVHVNGLRLKGKMPIRLKNITPGRYDLRLTAPEYHDWQKTVEVKNQETLYLKDIQMMQQNKPVLLNKGAIKNIWLSPNGRFLLYVVTTVEENKIFLRDNSAHTVTFLTDLPKNLEPHVTWAKENNYVALYTLPAPYEIVLLVDASETSNSPLDLTKKIPSITKVQWLDVAQPEIYIANQSTTSSVYRFAVATGELTPIPLSTYADWSLEGTSLWAITLNTSTRQWILLRDALHTKNNFLPLKDAGGAVSPQPGWELLTAYQGQALVKERGHEEIKIVASETIFPVLADTFFLSPYNNWLLLWSPHELWTYTIGEEPRLLNRSGERLMQVVPLDNNNTLDLRWSDKVTVLFPYYLISHEFINGQLTALAVNSEERIAYFSGSIDGEEGLWQLTY